MGTIRDKMIDELNSDPMYAEALKLLSDEDKLVVRATLEKYLTDIAENFLEQLASRVSDEEFKTALKRELSKVTVGNRYYSVNSGKR